MRSAGAVLVALLVLVACSAEPERGVDQTIPTTAPSADPTAAPSSTSSTTAEVSTASSSPTTAAPTTTVPEPLIPDYAFFFSPGRLPANFVEDVAALEGMRLVSLVTSGTMHVTASLRADGTVIDAEQPGFVVPVEGNVADPAVHAPFLVPAVAELLEDMTIDEVILGESSAELRQVGVGDKLRFENGTEVSVLGVVDDSLFGSTEILAADPELFLTRGRPRQVVYLDFDGTLSRLERLLRTVVGEDASFRLGRRGPAPTILTSRPAGEEAAEEKAVDDDVAADDAPAETVPSATDDDDEGGEVADGRYDDLPTVARVLTQLEIKKMFGEFAYKPSSGERVQIDQAWNDEFLEPRYVPLLGMVKCHTMVTDLLIEVMNELIADGLEEIIDPKGFKGCWNPRYIAGSNRLSHHAWGIAVDMNFFNALDGSPGSPVNKELLRRMNDAGFTSGHLFTNADPGHFEFFGPQE